MRLANERPGQVVEVLAQRFIADGPATRGQLRQLGFRLPHTHVAAPRLQELMSAARTHVD
jgi:hypothetical protein